MFFCWIKLLDFAGLIFFCWIKFCWIKLSLKLKRKFHFLDWNRQNNLVNFSDSFDGLFSRIVITRSSSPSQNSKNNGLATTGAHNSFSLFPFLDTSNSLSFWISRRIESQMLWNINILPSGMTGIIFSIPRWKFLLHLTISLLFLEFLDILISEDGYRCDYYRVSVWDGR